MRIGFLGLGDIGMPMAQRLGRAGFEAVVADLDPGRARRLADEGAVAASGYADFRDCRVVGLAVPDDAAVESIVLADEFLNALPDGATVLVHSTVLPATPIRLAETLRKRGLVVQDAPVSGGASRAAEGTLTIMLGGDPSEDAAAVLAALGTTVRCGPVGAGAAVKLANQLSMLAALAALHEGLAIAEHYGAAERTVLDVLATSTGASWSAENWGFFDRLAATYDENGVDLRYRPWCKDLWDVVATARDADLRVPLAAMLSQTLPDAVEAHARAAR